MRATLTFATRLHAEQFSTKITRFTKEGTMVGSGTENVKVTVFNVTNEVQMFINEYVSNLNKITKHKHTQTHKQ